MGPSALLADSQPARHSHHCLLVCSTRCEAKMGQFKMYNSNKLTLMLRLSHAHLCSEHFVECDFVNFIAEYQTGFAKAEFVGLSTG